jgi:hypothetical protein
MSHRKVDFIIFDLDGTSHLLLHALCDTHSLPGLLINSEHICTAVAGSLHRQFSDSRLPNTHAGNILAKYGKVFTRDIKSCIMGRRMWFPASALLTKFTASHPASHTGGYRPPPLPVSRPAADRRRLYHGLRRWPRLPLADRHAATWRTPPCPAPPRARHPHGHRNRLQAEELRPQDPSSRRPVRVLRRPRRMRRRPPRWHAREARA